MRHILARIFAFMRPHLLLYIPGMIMYSSQLFMFGFLHGLLMSGLMAAIMDMSVAGIWNAAIRFTIALAAYMLVLATGVYGYMLAVTKATRDVKRILFRCFVDASLESSSLSHSGEGIATMNTDADTATSLFSDALNPVIACIMAIVMTITVVFVIDIRLGAAAVAMGALAFFAQTRFAGPLGIIGKRRLEANAASVALASNTFTGGLAARAFGLQDRMLTLFNVENKNMLHLNFRNAFINMWQDLFTSVQGWLVMAIVLGFGGWMVASASHDLTFPMLILALPMYQTLSQAMSNMGAAWAGMQAPKAAAERIFAVMDSVAPAARPTDTPPIDGAYNLSVKNLSFTYLGASEPTLQGITLDIPENKMVAFVGPSGSGKSTLLRTILGLYERNDLDITLGDHHKFTQVSPSGWRHMFAYVDQSSTLFDMTIGENIALGLGGHGGGDRVREAARQAHAHGFIQEMEQGYDTPCGELGGSLSGGQKQRIAIARALYRRSPILVFDEAASALDSDTERGIMETIEELRKNHTILIITHNLESTTTADMIVTMDGGRIAEVGTHESLIAQRGLYHSLFTQSKDHAV